MSIQKSFYIEWAKIGLWSFSEAAILALGGDPHDQHAEYFYPNISDQFPILKTRIERAVKLKKLKSSGAYVFPRDFINWAEIEKIDLPKLLIESVKELTTNPNELSADKPLSTKEENSLLKIIAALVYSKFNYSPTSANADHIIREVLKSVAESKISISTDTAEKWIKTAVGRYHPR